MFKKTVITVFVVLFSFSICGAEYYAVLITGQTPEMEPPASGGLGGGLDPPEDSYDCFWNDTFVMWESLWKFGWQKSM